MEAAAPDMESLGAAKMSQEDKSEPFGVERCVVKEEFIPRGAGGKIRVGGGSVIFPPGVLKNDGSIKLSVGCKIVPGFLQQGVIITPSISCDLSHVGLVPGCKVDVELLAFCFATQSVPIALVKIDDDSNEWKIVKEFRMGRDRWLRFKTSDFSTYFFAFMRRTGFGRHLHFPVNPLLFGNENGEVRFYTAVDDYLLIDKIEEECEKNGFECAWVMPKKISITYDEEIDVELECSSPPVTFGAKNRFRFLSDKLFDEQYVSSDFQLENFEESVGKPPVRVAATLRRPNGEQIHQTGRLRWKVNVRVPSGTD